MYCVGSSTVCVLRGELHCLCTAWGAPLFVYCEGSSTVCVLRGELHRLCTVWGDFECIFAVNHEVACRGVKSCSCHTKCRVFLSYEHDGVCLL